MFHPGHQVTGLSLNLLYSNPLLPLLQYHDLGDDTAAILYFNYENPLVKRLSQQENEQDIKLLVLLQYHILLPAVLKYHMNTHMKHL